MIPILFALIVRKILGLRPTDSAEIWRFGLWRAVVQARAADGSTVDVQPESSIIPPAQGVPVRVGIPGAVSVVDVGAVVLLGWEAGDPRKPYAVPAWEQGAGVSKTTLDADSVIVNGGTKGAARVDDGISLGSCSVTTAIVSGSTVITAVTINGVTLSAVPSDPGGKISSGSSTVKVG